MEHGMMTVDLTIVLILALTTLGGISQGFFRAAFSLIGLVLGLAVAEWNYGWAAAALLPLVHFQAAANAIGFMLLAILVMGLAGLAGKILMRAVHGMGLGCLDKMAGAAFGFLQGALMVTLVILVTIAFFPREHWLVEARLPRLFFGTCHLSTRTSPAELAERVQHGLKLLEKESPRWLHPGSKTASGEI
jgi:membrane protein required for colicin V production